MKQAIHTNNAPQAIGSYSQAIKVGQTVYLSGQIGLEPSNMQMANGIEAQIKQVFSNLKAVTEAASGNLDNIVKLNVYLTDLNHFGRLNEIMADYFKKPYPARAAVGVSSLPKNALVEVDAIMILLS